MATFSKGGIEMYGWRELQVEIKENVMNNYHTVINYKIYAFSQDGMSNHENHWNHRGLRGLGGMELLI